ncbi:hypothetical protein Tco_0665019 [Tanacetum coccineum]
MVQKVKATDASLGDTNCSGIISDKGNDQGLENQSKTSGDKAAGQGMNAMTKVLMGMIRTSDLPMTQNQWLSNPGVIYEDMLKGAQSGAKTKTFEDF